MLAAVAAFAATAVGCLALIGSVPLQQASWLAATLARAAGVLRVAALGHAGLALAASLAAAVNVACLIAPLGRRLGGLELRPMIASFLRSGMAAVPMAVLVYAAAGTLDWTAPGHLTLKATWLAATITAGLLAFAGTAVAVGGPEVDGFRRMVAERWDRR